MRPSHLSTALLASFAASPIEAPIPGYNVFVPEWEVQATPGSSSILLNGTVQEVLNQLHEIDPDYTKNMYLNRTVDEESPESLSTRWVNFPPNNVICGLWGGAGVKEVQDQVRYLNRVLGQPRNGGGPGNCGRVSCGDKAAVWWCNDHPEPKTLTSFQDIGAGVYAIQRMCKVNRKLSGQAFHPNNWNVIVRWEDC